MTKKIAFEIIKDSIVGLGKEPIDDLVLFRYLTVNKEVIEMTYKMLKDIIFS